MILLDANILIYASNIDCHQHVDAKNWIKNLLSSRQSVGIPWVTVWAFLRISTNPRIQAQPLTSLQALGVVQSWLKIPSVSIIEPGARHLELLDAMMSAGQATGSMVTDAVLAAIAIEHGATLATTDRDFSRFPGLSWINPLTEN